MFMLFIGATAAAMGLFKLGELSVTVLILKASLVATTVIAILALAACLWRLKSRC